MKQPIGMSFAGVALVVLGTAMISSRKLALWGVTHGKGRIWAKMLGEERAVKLTRYLFGPVMVVAGLVMAVAGFFAH